MKQEKRVKEIIDQVTALVAGGHFDCGNGRGEVTLRDVGLEADQREFAREYPGRPGIWDSPNIKTLRDRAWEMHDLHSSRGQGLVAEVYQDIVDLCDNKE